MADVLMYFNDVMLCYGISEEELKKAIPNQKKSFGIHRVWINGKAVLDGESLDRELTKNSGKAMRV